MNSLTSQAARAQVIGQYNALVQTTLGVGVMPTSIGGMDIVYSAPDASKAMLTPFVRLPNPPPLWARDMYIARRGDAPFRITREQIALKRWVDESWQLAELRPAELESRIISSRTLALNNLACGNLKSAARFGLICALCASRFGDAGKTRLASDNFGLTAKALAADGQIVAGAMLAELGAYTWNALDLKVRANIGLDEIPTVPEIDEDLLEMAREAPPITVGEEEPTEPSFLLGDLDETAHLNRKLAAKLWLDIAKAELDPFEKSAYLFYGLLNAWLTPDKASMVKLLERSLTVRIEARDESGTADDSLRLGWALLQGSDARLNEFHRASLSLEFAMSTWRRSDMNLQHIPEAFSILREMEDAMADLKSESKLGVHP